MDNDAYWDDPRWRLKKGAEDPDAKPLGSQVGFALWGRTWNTTPHWSPYWTCRALLCAWTESIASLADGEENYDMYYWMRYQAPLETRTHHKNLEAKTSAIPDAGKGLFTTVARKKDDLLCSFYGHWIDKLVWDSCDETDKEGEYAFSLGTVIDSLCLSLFILSLSPSVPALPDVLLLF